MNKNTAAAELDDWATNQVIDAYVDTKARIQDKLAFSKKNKKGTKFPVDAFPPFCQSLMKAYQTCFGAAPDHYGLGMLTIAGAVIGNAAWAVDRKSTHPPLLYSVIVDKPGRGKTPIIRELLRPLFKIEKRYREAHAEALRKHREANAAADGKNPTPPPLAKEKILNDFTLEAIYKVLRENPKGLVVFRDEIAAWINSMNAYKSKGSDEQVWLEIYNCGTAKINRQKADRALFIDNCFVSVIGTTQPAILATFAEGNKAYNGFLARILFSYPEDTEKIAYNNRQPDDIFRTRWEEIIQHLDNLPTKVEHATDDLDDASITPTLIRLSSEASILYQAYFNEIAKQVNESDDEIEQAMLTKFDSHVLRLALILTFLNWSEQVKTVNIGGQDVTPYLDLEDLEKIQISEAAMEGAIRLANYFRATALKVVGRLASPVDQLPENYQIWYGELPEEFDRVAAIKLAKDAQIGERTVGRLFNRTDLFRRVRQGVYLKVFV